VECYRQEGVGRLYQVNVLLTAISFWKLYKNSPSRISRVFHISGSISRVGEVPGDYLEGEYSMGEAV
jgi:hypothetical protein